MKNAFFTFLFFTLFFTLLFFTLFFTSLGKPPGRKKLGQRPFKASLKSAQPQLALTGRLWGTECLCGRQSVSVRESNSGKIMRNVGFASLVAPRMGAPTERVFANPPTIYKVGHLEQMVSIKLSTTAVPIAFFFAEREYFPAQQKLIPKFSDWKLILAKKY